MLSTGCRNQNNQKHFNRERGLYWKFRLRLAVLPLLEGLFLLVVIVHNCYYLIDDRKPRHLQHTAALNGRCIKMPSVVSVVVPN